MWLLKYGGGGGGTCIDKVHTFNVTRATVQLEGEFRIPIGTEFKENLPYCYYYLRVQILVIFGILTILRSRGNFAISRNQR